MTVSEHSRWIVFNAFGLGFGFVAMLQAGMFIEFGFKWDMHWVWNERPVIEGTRPYLNNFVSALVGGAIFGTAQAVAVRSRNVAPTPWIVATVIGFGALAVIVDWPLIALGLMGVIPGPVETIIATVGGGAFAGLFQYAMLRRRHINASKWLILWLVGLVVSLVPMVMLFFTLEALTMLPNWPIEVFIIGFLVGGFAALASGRALFSALAGATAELDRN
ncbi:MAG: hypothetical protein AAF438_07040 [Pseudomonadota bacterium]